MKTHYLFQIVAILALLVSSCAELGNNEERKEDKKKEDIVQKHVVKTKVSAINNVSILFKNDDKEIVISGYNIGDSFIGCLDYLNSNQASLECSGYFSPDTIYLEMSKFNDYETISILKSFKKEEKWNATYIQKQLEVSSGIEAVKVDCSKNNIVNYHSLSLESKKTSRTKMNGKKINGLKISFPQLIDTELGNNKIVNEIIVSSVCNSFSADIDSIEQLGDFYKNEMPGSFEGDIKYIMNGELDEFLNLQITGDYINFMSEVKFPTGLIIDRNKGRNISIEDCFDLSLLNEKLDSKFEDFYGVENTLEYSEANGKFIPQAFFRTTTGVVFFNETSGVFNASIYLSNEEISSLGAG